MPNAGSPEDDNVTSAPTPQPDSEPDFIDGAPSAPPPVPPDVAASGEMSDTYEAARPPMEQVDQTVAVPDRWEIGHRPRSDAEWQMEVMAVDALWRQECQRLQAESEAGKSYEIGKVPKTPAEWDREMKLKELNNAQKAKLADQEHRAELDFQIAKRAKSSEGTRSWVLIAVVAAVIAYPLVGMLSDQTAEDFGQFIAPVTAIAGTVIGYWFGSRDQGAGSVSGPSTDSGAGTGQRSTLV